MQIRMAHLQDQGISYAVFAADATSRTNSARAGVLARLTRKARLNNLRVDKAALMFNEGGTVKYYGTPDLVQYLANRGVSMWTHWIGD